jgi:hypothetical protein
MKFAQARPRKAASQEALAPPVVSQGEIALLAYELYQQRGRMDGQALEDWIKAEAILRQRGNGRSAP